MANHVEKRKKQNLDGMVSGEMRETQTVTESEVNCGSVLKPDEGDYSSYCLAHSTLQNFKPPINLNYTFTVTDIPISLMDRECCNY